MFGERESTFQLSAAELHAIWRGDADAAREARWSEFLQRHCWSQCQPALFA